MIIYHLVQQHFFEGQDPRVDYYPRAFQQDGFIHCTTDPTEMAHVANRFYREEDGPHVYLYVDSQRVLAEIKYDDNERKFPHIYGGLNSSAIVAIRPANRSPGGQFLAPEAL